MAMESNLTVLLWMKYYDEVIHKNTPLDSQIGNLERRWSAAVENKRTDT